MAYPDKINALVDVTADQTLAAGGHAARHNDVNDALDELEAVFTAPAADELALRPDGSTERVRIDSSGNVGLGESDPLVELDMKAPLNGSRTIYLRETPGGGNNPLGAFLKYDGSANLGELGGVDTTETAVLTWPRAGGEVTVTGDLIVDGGGVFLGGTAAANELDDYEEGTWTPTYEPTSGAFGSITYDAQTSGIYTRIGRMVYLQWAIFTDSISVGTASAEVRIGGLPFTPSSFSPSFQNRATVHAWDAKAWATDPSDKGYVINGLAQIRILTPGGAAAQVSHLGTAANNNQFNGVAFYTAA